MNLKQLYKKLIVSCQALENEPLHSSYIMSKMALAAKIGGASGIRANSIKDINAIKQCVNLPIIGIIKKKYFNSNIHITPTLNEIKKLISSNCEIIAMDATLRKRPKEKLIDIVKFVLKIPNRPLLMADCSSLEDAKHAEQIGFDIIGTTLYGYTQTTKNLSNLDNDFEFLKKLKQKINKPIFVEGKLENGIHARTAIKYGAYAVVIGSAITRPRLITQNIVSQMHK